MARSRRAAAASLLVLTLAACSAVTSSPADKAFSACETFISHALDYNAESTSFEEDRAPTPRFQDDLEDAAEKINEAASDDERFRTAAQSLTAWVDAARAYRDRYSNTDERSGSEEARAELNRLRLPVANECDAVFDRRV